jgi:hypothetical protein
MKLEKAILTEDINQLNEYTNEVYDRKSRVRSLLREELDNSTALKRIKEVGTMSYNIWYRASTIRCLEIDQPRRA